MEIEEKEGELLLLIERGEMQVKEKQWKKKNGGREERKSGIFLKIENKI